MKHWNLLGLVLLLLPYVYADPIALEFLQRNQESSQAILDLLRQPNETAYESLETYVQQHPESFIAHQNLLKLGFALGYPNRMRLLYLKNLRDTEIQHQADPEAIQIALSLMCWHYFLGLYHQICFEQNQQNADAYLALHHFQQTLGISTDFLPAWIAARSILMKFPSPKNAKAAEVCRYHIYRLWNQSNWNPTFFRVWSQEIVRQEVSMPSILQVTSSHQPIIASTWIDYLEAEARLAQWFVEPTLQDIQMLLEVAAQHYEQAMKRGEFNRDFLLYQGIQHLQTGLLKLQQLQAQNPDDAAKLKALELLFRRYLVCFYHEAKQYSLAEEQNFIVDHVLK